jgi:hypothetical protein
MTVGHIDPERRDRLRANGTDDAIHFRGDRVQRAGDPIVIERRGLDAEASSTAHARAQSVARTIGAGEVNRFATRASIT